MEMSLLFPSHPIGSASMLWAPPQVVATRDDDDHDDVRLIDQTRGSQASKVA